MRSSGGARGRAAARVAAGLAVGAIGLLGMEAAVGAEVPATKVPRKPGTPKRPMCAWNNLAYVYAYDPWLDSGGTTVYDQGQIIQSPDYNCGSDFSTVYADTKVCGMWGCSWEDRGHTTAQVQTTNWIVQPSQPCRSGTNRYRTHTKFNFQYYDPGPPPALNPGSLHAYSANEPEFTCK